MHIAKVRILRQTFAAQVVRAMQEISDRYRQAVQGQTTGTTSRRR
jgi:hypothetical protein